MSAAQSERVAYTGNEAVAQAMRQINPDVVAAYPITPQTEIVQYFSGFVADGDVHTEFVRVESEHSAMSACIGAAAGGARAMTATSANGLALMWEMLYIAASNRLPIVMPVVNRALSGPINIHCDHSDSMGARDSGWIQLYSENAQEAYDNAAAILDLNKTIQDQVRTASRAPKHTLLVVERLFTNPVVSAPRLARELDVHTASIQRCLDFLVDLGILKEATGKRRNRLYVAPLLIGILKER